AKAASMRAAIEWSWNLLEPWEASALRQCALFVGPFTREAAEAVVALPRGAPRAVDALQNLVEKSLLCRGPRFRLYASVRELALERWAEAGAEREAAERRYAQHHGARAEAVAGGIDGATRPDPSAIAALLLDLDDVLAAHERARAFDPEFAARIALAV